MDDLHNAVFSANVDRWSHLSTEEQHRRSEAIAMSGLRYFLLKASPNSTICFDKKTSISIEGDTGPYCQYAYARCVAIINKAGVSFNDVSPNWSSLTDVHSRRLLMSLLSLPDYHCKAITELDPSLVAKGLYELAKAFSSFYASPGGRVIGADTAVGAARLSLVNATKMALESNLTMLGITPLDEM
jgi:arginyl-tRNA synthetase